MFTSIMPQKVIIVHVMANSSITCNSKLFPYIRFFEASLFDKTVALILSEYGKSKITGICCCTTKVSSWKVTLNDTI